MINLIFISDNTKLITHIQKSATLFPTSILTSRGEAEHITILSYANSSVTLENFIINNIQTQHYSPYNSVIVFCDDKFYDLLVRLLGFSFCIFKIGNYHIPLINGNQIVNYLEKLIVKALRKSFVIKNMVLNNHHHLMRLPIRNFDYDALRELYNDLKNCDDIQDISLVEARVSSIKKLIKKPLSRENRKQKEINYVDDRNNWYAFGPEKHLRQETSVTNGHCIFCEISSKFRFGFRISDDQHFNVKHTSREGEKISGDFEDCHGVLHNVNKAKHINMLSSDYHKPKY
ncbi:hypothetical protein [Pantoea ananatis]|uniref:hypothetical protein n=1 Tax=Pantoea ananas TaxID=553 RepID=UPI001C88E43F|nr:hypothetical protein [Pantoea ananatis]QZE30477.1 hypothetical protein K4732_06875 [Pantoea ananatis]BEK80245.1 hypothetical protein EATA8330_31390 [Enterobacter asburiae]HEC5301595.1 hypothetical protein [Enterobacter asburiae]